MHTAFLWLELLAVLLAIVDLSVILYAAVKDKIDLSNRKTNYRNVSKF